MEKQNVAWIGTGVMGASQAGHLVKAGWPVKAYGHHYEKVAAKAPDGMVEAVYLPDHPFALAVQWHPEFSRLSDENSRRIFEAFVKAARK